MLECTGCRKGKNSLQRRYPHLLISMARRCYICEILYLLSAGLMRDPHLPVSKAKHMKKRISSSQRHYRHLLISTFSPSFSLIFSPTLSPTLSPILLPPFPLPFSPNFSLTLPKNSTPPLQSQGLALASSCKVKYLKTLSLPCQGRDRHWDGIFESR